jgi:hypothetical protein
VCITLSSFAVACEAAHDWQITFETTPGYDDERHWQQMPTPDRRGPESGELNGCVSAIHGMCAVVVAA